jgi:tetratricopeptide (TPR) repeat protein
LNPKRGNLAQAEAAFARLLTLGEKDAVWNGHLNLARVYIDQGRLTEAARALNAAQASDPPAPWWLLAWFKGLVTAQNATTRADLDEAARLLESIVDPTNQPKHEDGRIKYDFTKDYVVLAELGRTLYKRSTLEPQDSPPEREFLLRSVRAYERVLQVDPENLDAHYGLNQCYDRLGHAANRAGMPDRPITAQILIDFADRLLDKSLALETRVANGAVLVPAVLAYGKAPPDPQAPRLPTIRSLISRLSPAYHDEQDPTARKVIAATLANLHLVSHTLYTPDELARARATAVYRAKNPAANAAAEAIVLYPTNRPGAPGLAP